MGANTALLCPGEALPSAPTAAYVVQLTASVGQAASTLTSAWKMGYNSQVRGREESWARREEHMCARGCSNLVPLTKRENVKQLVTSTGAAYVSSTYLWLH